MTDAHVHLQDPLFTRDWEEVLEQALRINVRRFLCNGTEPDDWESVKNIAENRPEVLPCFGLHPWLVGKNREKDWETVLNEFLDQRSFPCGYCPGIGEIGLDFAVFFKSDSEREDVFRKQLRIAAERCLPVMIHSVRATSRIDTILSEEPRVPVFLLHSFSGPVDLITALVQKNGFFSFSANVLKEANRRVREAAVAIPEDRILLESDAPALPLVRGERNEPTILVKILHCIAELRKMPVDKLQTAICQNMNRFLEFWPQSEQPEPRTT